MQYCKVCRKQGNSPKQSGIASEASTLVQRRWSSTGACPPRRSEETPAVLGLDARTHAVLTLRCRPAGPPVSDWLAREVGPRVRWGRRAPTPLRPEHRVEPEDDAPRVRRVT